jgi:hypothetical protein
MSEGANGYEHRFQAISSVLGQLINTQKRFLQAQLTLSDREKQFNTLLEHVATIGSNLSRLAAKIAVVNELVRRLGGPGPAAPLQ